MYIHTDIAYVSQVSSFELHKAVYGGGQFSITTWPLSENAEIEKYGRITGFGNKSDAELHMACDSHVLSYISEYMFVKVLRAGPEGTNTYNVPLNLH